MPEGGGSSKDILFGLPADRGGWYFIAMNLGVLGMGAGATGLGRDAFCYRSKNGNNIRTSEQCDKSLL